VVGRVSVPVPGSFQETLFLRSEFPDEELEPDDILCVLPRMPFPAATNPRKLPAGAVARFCLSEEAREVVGLVSSVRPVASTPSEAFGFWAERLKLRIEAAVLARLCVGDECFRISLLSRRDSAGGGVALYNEGTDGSATTGSDEGGGTEAVELRSSDHRDFEVEDSEIGRLADGRWGRLFRRSARYCSVAC
jgi:hypothetical protein